MRPSLPPSARRFGAQRAAATKGALSGEPRQTSCTVQTVQPAGPKLQHPPRIQERRAAFAASER